MENQRQKWVNLSFLAAAALFGYIIITLLFKLAGVYDLEARFHDIDLYIRGISVLFGGGLFFYLYKNEKASQFMNEVVTELIRVTWPSRKDTYRATIVVIIMVIISGVFLGGLDTFWTWIMKSIF